MKSAIHNQSFCVGIQIKRIAQKNKKGIFTNTFFTNTVWNLAKRGHLRCKDFCPSFPLNRNSFHIDFNPNQPILSKTTVDLWSCPLYTMSLRDSTVTTKQSGYSNQLSYLMVSHPKCLSKVSFRPISNDLLFNINISVITRLNKNTMITEDDLLSRL